MPQITLCAFADEANSDFTRQIAALLRNRIFNIEIRGVDGINIADLDDEKAKECASRLRDNGIAVWSLGSPLGKTPITAPREEHEEMLKRLLHLADIFSTKRIRMFSYFVDRPDYSRYRDEVVERINRLVEIAKGYRLCHENESAIFGSTVDNCADIYDHTPGLYSVFDSSNFIQWGEDIDYAIQKLGSRADYFHVKDSRYDTRQIVPCGYGDGRYDRIVASLDRDATFTIEPHLKEFTGYSDLDKKQLDTLFSFSSGDESFDAAAQAFKKILAENNYIEGDNGKWTK